MGGPDRAWLEVRLLADLLAMPTAVSPSSIGVWSP
jgi:hypothetical protein